MSQKTDDFINLVAPLMIAEKQRRQANALPVTRVDVGIAQAACESAWGTCGRMVNANALFGIKATNSWLQNGGRAFNSETQECYNGIYVETSADFRAYDSVADSVADYFALICDSGIYELDESSAYNCISTIQKTPYATSPTYVDTIMSIILDFNLSQYEENTPAIAPQELSESEQSTHANANNENPMYTVVAGDTLSEIAQMFHVSEDDIANANNIVNHDYIQIGQVLTIPVVGSSEISEGDRVKVTTATDYNGCVNASWVVNATFTVMDITGDRVVIGNDGIVTGAWHKLDIVKA